MMDANEKREKLLSTLPGFTGTMDYHKSTIFIRNFYHTDGVQFLAETAGAYWLIDAIVSWQTKARVRCEEFQIWKLIVNPANRSCVLVGTDGNRNHIARQKIGYTDFPLDDITLYLELGSLDMKTPAWILMLPSER